jgi:methyl-accepting chemotaxis protein
MKNKRASFLKRTYIVDRAFQIKFILKIVSFVILATLITGVVTYFITDEALERSFYSIHYQIKNVWQILLPSVVVISFVTTGIVAFFTTAVALIESHRVGGPIYRFKSTLKEVESGDLTVVTKLRARDDLQDFVVSLNNMVEGLKGRVASIDDSYNSLNKDISVLLESLSKTEVLSESDRGLIENINKGVDALRESIEQFEFKG